MTSYLVKHDSQKQGKLEDVISVAKKLGPVTFTSKKRVAEAAVNGNIYVVEIVAGRGKRNYRLGYKFKCAHASRPAGGGKWLSQFNYKNSADIGSPSGVYFSKPASIVSPEFLEWCREQCRGMDSMPWEYANILDGIFGRADLGAIPF